MSTNCQIKIIEKDVNPFNPADFILETVHLYRHWDGYPDINIEGSILHDLKTAHDNFKSNNYKNNLFGKSASFIIAVSPSEYRIIDDPENYPRQYQYNVKVEQNDDWVVSVYKCRPDEYVFKKES